MPHFQIQSPFEDLKTDTAVVHLWWIILKTDMKKIETLSEILSPDEKEKTKRFRFQKHRNQFILTRAALRTILARYLKTEAGDLRFAYNKFGKPQLETSPGNHGLCFNLSHSNEIALCAVAEKRQLGIDIEWNNDIFDWEAIAEKYFSAHEITDIYNAPVSRRQELFLNYWTSKEAYLKAVGKGLLIPFNEVEIFKYCDHPEGLLGLRVKGIVERSWSLRRIVSPTGYVGALAAEGYDFETRNIYTTVDQDYNRSPLLNLSCHAGERNTSVRR